MFYNKKMNKTNNAEKTIISNVSEQNSFYYNWQSFVYFGIDHLLVYRHNTLRIFTINDDYSQLHLL